MICGECTYMHSDCDQGGMWRICIHPELESNVGEEPAVYADSQPEWCPLITREICMKQIKLGEKEIK